MKADPGEISKERSVVESRLLSSKALAKEIADVIQMLRIASGEDAGSSKGRNAGALTKGHGTESKDEEGGDDDEGYDTWTGLQDEDEDVIDDADGAGDNEELGQEEKRGSFKDDIDDEDALGWESGTVYSSTSDDEQASAPNESPSSSLHQKKTKAREGLPKDSGMKTKAGESTFLPSLSVGFVDGSSGSEWSDGEADVADAPVKKNRRGQRARKA